MYAVMIVADVASLFKDKFSATSGSTSAPFFC